MSYLSKNSNGGESKMKSFIFVKTQKEGFHFWKDAPAQISFLRNVHRHIFFIETYISIKHNNREIEFFMFKKEVESMITNIWYKYNLDNIGCSGVSCEMISNELRTKIIELYPKREVRIYVSEDNENGSYIEY